jgi:preprotein translocase subunit SecA
MKKTLTATMLCALATPALAGGPVVIIDEPEVVAERPASSINPIIPLLLLVAIGLAVSGGGNGEGCTPDSATDC